MEEELILRQRRLAEIRRAAESGKAPPKKISGKNRKRKSKSVEGRNKTPAKARQTPKKTKETDPVAKFLNMDFLGNM